MWKVMLPKRRHIVMLLVGSALVYALVYLQAVAGEPYEYARAWVRSDPRVIEVTGAQLAQGFNFWHGYEYSFSATEGSASLELSVEGGRGKFNVRLVLQKRQGRWTVVSANAVNEKGEAVVIVG
jgi:hypothetical protein